MTIRACCTCFYIAVRCIGEDILCLPSVAVPCNIVDAHLPIDDPIFFKSPEAGGCCYSVSTASVQIRDPAKFGQIVSSIGPEFLDCPDCLFEPTEACCLPNGGCFTTTVKNCLLQNGVPQGPGTNCGNVECPKVGPCPNCKAYADSYFCEVDWMNGPCSDLACSQSGQPPGCIDHYVGTATVTRVPGNPTCSWNGQVNGTINGFPLIHSAVVRNSISIECDIPPGHCNVGGGHTWMAKLDFHPSFGGFCLVPFQSTDKPFTMPMNILDVTPVGNYIECSPNSPGIGTVIVS